MPSLEMSPKLKPHEGVLAGKDMDEQTRAAAGGSVGPGSEHLASEDNLEVHAETLRRRMPAEGLWSRARKRKQHRERREAKGTAVSINGLWIGDGKVA